jgi:hypothetical protein
MKKVFFVSIIAVVAMVTGCQDKDDTKQSNELAGITVVQSSVALKPGASEELTLNFFPADADDKSVNWTSSNAQVATVSNGVVTAVTVGFATITATSAVNPYLKATCDISVAWETKTVSGNVEGVWEKNTTVNITGHVTVPEGKSLTIEEGCEIIFAQATPGIEFLVEGNLYCKGKADNPVLFTVAPSKRIPGNIFEGLWGGVIFGTTCNEALIDNAIFEYSGSTITSTSPSLKYGYKIAAGDPQCTILGGKIGGKYVIINSILRYCVDNPFYLWGGDYIIANNLIVAAGHTAGGDAIAPKSGTKVDACFNVIFSPNTNGLKLSSSGQSETVPQGLARTYNNTIINGGWRRNGDKGGSIYVEKGVLAAVFNNLMVNCKFRAQTPTWNNPSPSNGADQASIIDYNFYCSGSQKSILAQDNPNYLTSFLGYTSANSNYWFDGRLSTPVIEEHALVCASAGDAAFDPKFVNYGFNTVPLHQYEYNEAWDFRVAADSPVLTGAQSNFSGVWTGYFTSSGLTVGGVEYKSPAPKPFFGAKGTN